MWNPIEAVKQKYPKMGLTDAEIFQRLSDPAKFRSAFPEYDGLSDNDIRANMQKVGLSRPDLQAPPKPASGAVPADKMKTSLPAKIVDFALAGPTKSDGSYVFSDENLNKASNDTLGFDPSHLASGAVKGAGQGLLDLDNMVRHGLNKLGAHYEDVDPTDFGASSPDVLDSKSKTESVGKFAETIAEFMAGEGELKAVGMSEKLLKAGKLAELLEGSPRLAKALGIGISAMRQGLVGGAQGFLHSKEQGMDAVEDGLKEGAWAGGTAGVLGAATEGLGAVAKKLAPKNFEFPKMDLNIKRIEGEEANRLAASGVPEDALFQPVGSDSTIAVPVRSSVESPSWLRSAAEFVASKPALQKFDVAETQSAARDVLQSLANDAKNTAAIQLQRSLTDGLKDSAKLATERVQSAAENGVDLATVVKGAAAVKNAVTDRTTRQLRAFVEDSSKNATNFWEAGSMLKQRLQGLYQEVENQYPKFKELQDAAKAAYRVGDFTAERKAIEGQRKFFEAVHGKGTYDAVTNLYSRADALGTIGDSLASKSVVKPTPVNLLHVATQGGRVADPGIIDGKALRSVIRDLSQKDEIVNGKLVSVFDRAGIQKGSVDKLQELAVILERSDPNRIGAKVGRAIGGPLGAGAAGGGVAEGLSLAMSHSLSLASIPYVGGAFAVGAAANKFLGKLMTDPHTLDYTLRAARRLAPAASAAVAQPTPDNKQEGEQ